MRNSYLKCIAALLVAMGASICPLLAQIDYQRTPEGIRIGPTQAIPPCVRITPEGPLPCEAEEGDCGTPDISLSEYRALPWFGRTEEYLNQAYDSLNAIYGSANVRGEDDIEQPWLRVSLYSLPKNSPNAFHS
jgi:hypothetical protein